MTIQRQEAEALQRAWEAGNNGICTHQAKLEKEYEAGSATGDHVCPLCGESRWGSNWNRPTDTADNN